MLINDVITPQGFICQSKTINMKTSLCALKNDFRFGYAVNICDH